MNKDVFAVFANEAPDIAAEASAWLAQLETGELRAADLDAFREWMCRSPRHAAEIKRLAKLSQNLNVLTEMAEPIHEAAMHYRPVIGRGDHWRRFKSVYLGALSTIAGVLFILLFFSQATDEDLEPMLITTAIGETREVELPDGTRITLNTDSRLEVDYDTHRRNARLLSGEAFFDVTPNANRPFWVYAGENNIRVVGTAFLVRLLQENLAVTVTKGRVELAKTAKIPEAGKPPREPVKAPSRDNTTQTLATPFTLQAGQSITITKHEVRPVATVSAREIQRELSWQDGLLDFSNTTLEKVVNDLGRYTPLQIEITDPKLRELEFSGLFRIGEVQPLFKALESEFGIQVEYVDDTKVRLSSVAQ
jgi:transmembrane sensor